MPFVLHAVLGLLVALGVPVHGTAPSPLPATPRGQAVARTAPGSGWPALDASVARIPGYLSAAPTTWQVSDRYGHLGSTLVPAELVSISPSVPAARLDSVVRHEWAHVLASRAYGGDVPAMVAALDAAFGGSGARGVDGVEDAADCMARQLGATWTHYTPCTDPVWRADAAVLLAGHRLPSPP